MRVRVRVRVKVRARVIRLGVNYDAILNKAMERLEKTLRSNASLEVRMRQLGLRQALGLGLGLG